MAHDQSITKFNIYVIILHKYKEKEIIHKQLALRKPSFPSRIIKITACCNVYLRLYGLLEKKQG